ncbi:hypothetical protein T09_1821 [Trichinella sp. T9]|nr:hypothetical protein T09_1821 [Trichinella sp. T9]
MSDRTSVVFESNLTFRNYSKIRMWIQNMDMALNDHVQKVQQLLLAGKQPVGRSVYRNKNPRSIGDCRRRRERCRTLESSLSVLSLFYDFCVAFMPQ